MKIIDNKVLYGTAGRHFSFDLYLPDSQFFSPPYPLLIFAHGFKGFKDWGHWNKIAETFAENGFAFLKFNFSHNGTSPQNPTEFCDLEAFGNNTFSKELSDLGDIINWASEHAELFHLDPENFSLIGHSRGGPIVILKAANDARILKTITWAAVHELDYAWQDSSQLEKWKKETVIYSKNARTGQEMPLFYQLYEDFSSNRNQFSVKNALSNLSKPLLIIHGDKDPAVPLSSAENLKKYALSSKLVIIEGADHVFGGKHPFPEDEELSSHSMELIRETINFLNIRTEV
jgi:pimeloyl-ACP methyl ester carboxylesterase